MGIHKHKSHTLPSSPIHHHSSSSDFEFTISLSPKKSTATNIRPADELFYKGQLLPLHLCPRNSMVRNLLTMTARHSSDYNSSFSYETSDSSRPSSATEDDYHIPQKKFDFNSHTHNISNQKKALVNKQFSFNTFTSVFHAKKADSANVTVKEKIINYLKKAKPMYNKLSQLHNKNTKSVNVKRDDEVTSSSFTGNLRFLRRTSCVSSCPSTMPSSPNHSGVLNCRGGGYINRSSTDEHSAIQGAIMHCKNSLT